MNDIKQSIDKANLAHELTKAYTFANFDFKNQKPSELVELYQNTFIEISKSIDSYYNKIFENYSM